MEALNLFYEAVNDPVKYAKNWKKRNRRKIVGYFCSYTPEEIIHAGGMLPFRIFDSGNQTLQADTHLQAYCCSFVRAALEDALSGKLDFLDGTVFPHTCDSIQRLSDIWRLNVGFDFHADIVLPVRLDTESAHHYLVNVFKKFQQEFEKGMDIEISTDKLKNTLKTYNALRGSIQKIYALRHEDPYRISSRDIQVIAQASMIMDRDEFVEQIPAVIEALTRRKSDQATDKKKLVLTGGICNLPDIYPIIEAAGGVVVADDFCIGSRHFEGIFEPGEKSIESIALRYRQRMVCPAKHAGLFKRGEQIIHLVKENEAQGVVFLLLKYCDPHAFDYPYIRSLLEKEGIPSLLLEIEGRQVSRQQLKTRCEVFVDML